MPGNSATTLVPGMVRDRQSMQARTHFTECDVGSVNL